jgi:uncharacterized protein YegP (UPF0339 family)
MGLFKKKEKTDKKALKEKAKTAEQASSASAPSLKNVKPAAPASAPKAAPAKPVAKAAPAKPAAKPAPAKPAAKPAEKAPAAKTAAKPAAKPAVKAAPPRVTAVPSRPFFMTTEEDIRIAFDQAIEEADRQILQSKEKASGKYEFALEVDGFHFYLWANNGQLLFDSPSFTTLLGALNGLKTFQKAVQEGNFDIRVDKYDRYRFILARKYYGENYTTKEQCAKCVESVKKFANNSKILRCNPSKEEIKAFESAKATKRTPESVDWRAVEKAEAAAQKMGKFEICAEGDQYCFYLLANNGQILYSSRYYANEKACRSGIDSFKRAAYVGNFFVDRDKFGNYRYVLKNIGSAPSFIGESYDNKPQCEKIIESVKNFIVTASIELEVKAIE